MKNILVCLIASLLAGFTFNATAADAPDLKYGLYIHYGIASFAQAGEQGQIPVERFNPAALDVKDWAHAAKQAGMTFAVLTAKHESGFCLWDSADYDYDVGGSPFKGDLIGDFIAACNAEGILPGVHYSIPDQLNEGAVRYKGPVPPPYFSLIKKHITELHTKYPGLRVQIFDGSERLAPAQVDALKQLIHQLNPKCVILEHHQEATVIKGWMWQAQAPLIPADNLFDGYCRADAAGQPFLLNVGPTSQGIIPDAQLAVLMQVKEMIAQNNVPVTADSLKQGLILHYDFDHEFVGGKVPDLSGSKNDGTAVGVQWVAKGHRGGSMQFGLKDCYITVPNNDSLNPPQFTLSAWIQTSFTDWIWRRIFDKCTGHGYDLTMGGDDKTNTAPRGQVFLEVGSGWNGSGIKVADGRWHHVVGTFNGSALHVYVDGKPMGRVGHWIGVPVKTAYDLTIGANRSNPDASLGEVGPSFNGSMDDVMMFNRALSAKEVKALYEAQKTADDDIKTTPADASAKPDAGARLKQVKSLFDQGLINKDDYDKKVKEIIDSL